jgi:HPt (histidine-containing phosphotransfer) domain-containing protein
MSDAKYEAIIPRHLADSIAGFMETCRKELDAFEAAFASGDLGELEKLATNMNGYGAAYGLERIAELGMELEQAAQRDDYDAAAAYLLLYREYLDQVRITFAQP